VLLGAMTAQQPQDSRVEFALGAVSASFVWFFGLGFGARILVPVFAKPGAWKVLDAGVALMMWAIAATLIVPR